MAVKDYATVKGTRSYHERMIGTKQAGHVRENLAIAGRMPLSSKQFAKLFT